MLQPVPEVDEAKLFALCDNLHIGVVSIGKLIQDLVDEQYWHVYFFELGDQLTRDTVYIYSLSKNQFLIVSIYQNIHCIFKQLYIHSLRKNKSVEFWVIEFTQLYSIPKKCNEYIY